MESSVIPTSQDGACVGAAVQAEQLLSSAKHGKEPVLPGPGTASCQPLAPQTDNACFVFLLESIERTGTGGQRSRATDMLRDAGDRYTGRHP